MQGCIVEGIKKPLFSSGLFIEFKKKLGS